MPRRHHEADSPTLSSEKLSRTRASTWHGAPKLMGDKERWHRSGVQADPCPADVSRIPTVDTKFSIAIDSVRVDVYCASMVERGTHIITEEWDGFITDVPRVHTCCETCGLLGCPAQHELECDNVGATDSSGRFYPWARLEERWGTEAVERIRSIVEERYREAGRYDEDGSFDCGWT